MSMNILEKSRIASLPVAGLLVAVFLGILAWKTSIKDAFTSGLLAVGVLIMLAFVLTAGSAILTKKKEAFTWGFPLVLNVVFLLAILMVFVSTTLRNILGFSLFG